MASFAIGDNCSLTFVQVKNHSGPSVKPLSTGWRACAFCGERARRLEDDGGLTYACDLGMDITFSYVMDWDRHLTELCRAPTEPGVGPRQLVQNAEKPILHVITYLDLPSRLNGTLKLLQTASLKAGGRRAADASKAGEILIVEDGQLVLHPCTVARTRSPWHCLRWLRRLLFLEECLAQTTSR